MEDGDLISKGRSSDVQIRQNTNPLEYVCVSCPFVAEDTDAPGFDFKTNELQTLLNHLYDHKMSGDKVPKVHLKKLTTKWKQAEARIKRFDKPIEWMDEISIWDRDKNSIFPTHREQSMWERDFLKRYGSFEKPKYTTEDYEKHLRDKEIRMSGEMSSTEWYEKMLSEAREARKSARKEIT